MEEKKERKRATEPVERVTLGREAVERIDHWLQVAKQAVPGMRLIRPDLVTHLILSHSPELSAQEIKGLRKRYFDEVEYAAWIVREMKRAREQGETVSLHEMLRRVHKTPGSAKPGDETDLQAEGPQAPQYREKAKP